MPKVLESEDELITRAQQALSSCNWVIGECASKWTQKYSKGRTDGDFGAIIGLSGDQVFQRRRVWDVFSDVYENYPRLKWSHFYLAVNWDDAAECLQWANEMDATVAEMRAWRRAQHGDDLTEQPQEEAPFSTAPEFLAVGVGMVQDPGEYSGEPRTGSSGGAGFPEDHEYVETAVSAARESGNSDYAPFGKGARGSAPQSERQSDSSPSAEQVFKKAAITLERVVSSLTPEVLEGFRELPIALQQRFLDAIENLQSRSAGLS